MKTNEAYSRVRINSMIEFAGFKLKDFNVNEASVGYENGLRNSYMKARLHNAGKIPDYHFYPPQSSIPIAFLEAKRIGGKKLECALHQAIEYAQIACDSSTPPMVVFASDGIQVRSRHADGSELSLNNYPVDYIPPFDLMRELVKSPSVSQGEAIDSVNSLINIFEHAADSMRRDGIDSGINQLREFCVLLFIKIMSERGNLSARENWQKISQTSGQNLIREYRAVLQPYKEAYGEIFSSSEINNPEILEHLIGTVGPINFTNSGIDIKGQAFEYFLSKYSTGSKSALGQYFTPRHVTSMMSNLLDPQPGDKILDPFCGTGGMLIACYSKVRMDLDSDDSAFEGRLEELKNNTLYGNDISGSASGLAKMNMILLGDGQSNIKRYDSFSGLERKKYDKLITNIPFNIDAPIDHERVMPFIKASSLTNMDWNELCVVKCIESLKNGGSAAIVLPLTLCHSDRYQELRSYIAKKCNIRACIRLPEKTFVFYTTAQTAILIIDNAHSDTTNDFIFVHIKSDGMSQDKNRDPIPENDFPALLEFATENQLSEMPGAVRLKFRGGGGSNAFVEFGKIVNASGDCWRLGELLWVKERATLLVPDEYYAEPGLDSQNNTVKVRGNLRLGKNIREAEKVVAEPGDLIIGTLHTNNRNGLFAISNARYICTSQIVAKIKNEIVPVQYLIHAMRREFPRQLIPTDLVGREQFTKEQILDVLIPKPDKSDLEELYKLNYDIEKMQSNLFLSNSKMQNILDKYGG